MLKTWSHYCSKSSNFYTWEWDIFHGGSINEFLLSLYHKRCNKRLWYVLSCLWDPLLLISSGFITPTSTVCTHRKEGHFLFNDALNTFYLQLYGVRHMVKDHSDSEKGNLLPPHRLLFTINSKGSFICIIPQTG